MSGETPGVVTKSLGAMFDIVARMDGKRWCEVQMILEPLYHILVEADAGWAAKGENIWAEWLEQIAAGKAVDVH